MKITWLPGALQNREMQLDFIAERNPMAAVRLGDAIAAAVRRLSEFPEIAPHGRVNGTRELLVPETPYIVIYRIEAAELVILRLLHDSQRWPPVGER